MSARSYTPEALAARLRQTRTLAEMTLKEAADRLSEFLGRPVHFTTVSKLETARIRASREWLSALAHVYGVDEHDLWWSPDPFSVIPAAVEVPLASRHNLSPERWSPPDEDSGSFVLHRPPDESYGIILPHDELSAVFTSSDWFVIIDPALPELEDGCFYLVRRPAKDALMMFIAETLELVPSAALDGGRVRLGTEPIEILGRARLVGRDVGLA